MHTLTQVIQRQFRPLLEMLHASIEACPDEAFTGEQIGLREHIYHALVGMDVWMSPDPTRYPFDQIVDDGAAQLERAASSRISRQFLIDCLGRVEAKVSALPEDSTEFFRVAMLRGKPFTLLDRCLGQLRHVQHHIGAVNEILRSQGRNLVEWRGYGE